MRTRTFYGLLFFVTLALIEVLMWSAPARGQGLSGGSGVSGSGGGGSAGTNVSTASVSAAGAAMVANNGSDFANGAATLANLGGVTISTNLLAGHTFTFDASTLWLNGLDPGDYYIVPLTKGQTYFFSTSGTSDLNYLMNADTNAIIAYNLATGGFPAVQNRSFFVAATNHAVVVNLSSAVNGAPITNDFLFQKSLTNYISGAFFGDLSGSGALMKSNNLSDIPLPHTAFGNLVAQSDNTAFAVVVTNGLVSFGSDHMGINDASGTPQYTFSANSHSSYRGTNIVAASKENLVEVINYDRTAAGYIAFQAGITNAGSTNSTLSPAQDAQIGLSGDLYNRRLASPFPNFNRTLFIALNSPVDFILSSTANVGTNAGTMGLWDLDNTNGITYFNKTSGGPSHRDVNHKAALVINHLTGAITATNGLVTVSNLTATGTITGNGSGLTNASGSGYASTNAPAVWNETNNGIFNIQMLTGQGTNSLQIVGATATNIFAITNMGAGAWGLVISTNGGTVWGTPLILNANGSLTTSGSVTNKGTNYFGSAQQTKISTDGTVTTTATLDTQGVKARNVSIGYFSQDQLAFSGAAGAVNFSANNIMRSGTGTPEASVTAIAGSLYLRTDGGAGTTLYIKESGTGNTGWIAK